MITLDDTQVRIVKTHAYYSDEKWYVLVEYTVGERDIFGPFNTKEEAEGLIL
jgi:hypothetical protein